MHRKDLLWKAAIEEFFYELLEFFYSDFLPKIDLSKGFTFLEQELQQLYEKSEEDNRRADKLVKIYLKDGTEQWFLIHIEVQGYPDPNFARRMFTYYYRLVDKFNKPVEALVIYTDKGKKHHYKAYTAKAIKTKLSYEFNSFEITRYTNEEYEAMQNPFAVIFQTALLGLKKKWDDEDLLQEKTLLYRNLLKKGYTKNKIRELASFIKMYVNFSKPTYNLKFDEVSTTISKNPENMGIIETILYIKEEEGKEIGKEIGKKLGEKLGEEKGKKEKEKALLIKQLQSIGKLLQSKVPISTIAAVENVPTLFVEEFDKHLNKNKHALLLRQVAALYDKLKVPVSKRTKQVGLIEVLLSFGFSDNAIAAFLGWKATSILRVRKKWKQALKK